MYLTDGTGSTARQICGSHPVVPVNATWSPRVLLTLLVVLAAVLVAEMADSPVSLLVAASVVVAVVVRAIVAARQSGEGDAADHGTT